MATGLLGVGVPRMPVHAAIRYGTLAVLASACSASLAGLADGRANPLVGLMLAVDSGRRALGLWFEAQGITLQKPGSSS